MNTLSSAQAPILNGIDLLALGDFVEQVKSDPAKADVQFSVMTRWSGQTRSETTINQYQLAGRTIERRFKVIADEPVELLGCDSGPNPQELLMTALNACMAVGYVAQAAVQGIELRSLEIETSGRLDLRGFLGIDDSVPPGYRQLDYTIRISGTGSAAQFRGIHQAVMTTSPNFFNLAQPICMNGRLEVI